MVRLREVFFQVFQQLQVITGFIPGFSDYDFVLFLRGSLSVDDAFAVQRGLARVDTTPFSYVQLSRIVDIDDRKERRNGLIAGAYVVMYGRLPGDWTLHSDELLVERSVTLRAGRQDVAS